MLTMKRFGRGPYIITDCRTGKVMSYTTFKEAWAYIKICEFTARVTGTLPTRKTQVVELIPPEIHHKKKVTYKVYKEGVI